MQVSFKIPKQIEKASQLRLNISKLAKFLTLKKVNFFSEQYRITNPINRND